MPFMAPDDQQKNILSQKVCITNNGDDHLQNCEPKLESVFIKFADTRMKTITVSIDTARSEQAIQKLINERLRGKEILLNDAVEIHRNGHALTDFKEVQHGDTLRLKVVRSGLCGGMQRNNNPFACCFNLCPGENFID